MRTFSIGVLVGALIAAPVALPPKPQEVEHAPTVAQCQADQALWSSVLSSGAKDATFRTLLAWHKEMDKCEVVDDQNLVKYLSAVHLSTAAMFLRQNRFIERHKLAERFYAEDEAGLR